MKAPDWPIHEMIATLRNVASDLESIANNLEKGDGNLSSKDYDDLFGDACLACEYITHPAKPHL